MIMAVEPQHRYSNTAMPRLSAECNPLDHLNKVTICHPLYAAGTVYIRCQASFNPNEIPLKLIKYLVVDALVFIF